jgi:excisionase family DNA binding protein
MAKAATIEALGLSGERLLTPEQVAARLQLSPITIIHWLRAQKLPGVKLGGKLWRVRESDLLQPSSKLPLPQCGVSSTFFMRGQWNH